MTWTSSAALRLTLTVCVSAGVAAFSAGTNAQEDPVAQRASEGAKAYVAANNLENPKLNILLNSLYRNAMPDFADEWKELTGVEIVSEPLGYTDIPSKIMGEAVARKGAFDIFNDFPYTQPDAAGAGVLQPLDEYVAKGQPDFSGIPEAFVAQQQYDGKQYSFVLDGDHIMLVLRKDIVEKRGSSGRIPGSDRQGAGLSGDHGRLGRAGEVLPHRGRPDALGHHLRATDVRRDGISLGQLLAPAFSGLLRWVAV